MKPYRVIAELLDLQENYSNKILNNDFYNSFVVSVITQINDGKSLTEKQKITIYYIKKQLEILEKKQSSTDSTYYDYQSSSSRARQTESSEDGEEIWRANERDTNPDTFAFYYLQK